MPVELTDKLASILKDMSGSEARVLLALLMSENYGQTVVVDYTHLRSIAGVSMPTIYKAMSRLRLTGVIDQLSLHEGQLNNLKKLNNLTGGVKKFNSGVKIFNFNADFVQLLVNTEYLSTEPKELLTESDFQEKSIELNPSVVLTKESLNLRRPAEINPAQSQRRIMVENYFAEFMGRRVPKHTTEHYRLNWWEPVAEWLELADQEVALVKRAMTPVMEHAQDRGWSIRGPISLSGMVADEISRLQSRSVGGTKIPL